MIDAIIILVSTVADVLTLLLLVYVILSFFLSPFHPIRQTLASLLEPFLAPIRRMMPAMGGFDFSPVVLWLVIILVERVLVQVLLTLR